MLSNRSVPTDVLLPHVTYGDLEQAIGWLSRVFGFSEHYRYGDPLSGAQMHLGNAWIMLKQGPCGPSAAETGMRQHKQGSAAAEVSAAHA